MLLVSFVDLLWSFLGLDFALKKTRPLALQTWNQQIESKERLAQ